MGILPCYSCGIDYRSIFWLWIDEIRWRYYDELSGKAIDILSCIRSETGGQIKRLRLWAVHYQHDHVYRILYGSEPKLPFWSGKWFGTVGRCK